MKFPQKVKKLIAPSCDKFFLQCGSELYAVDANNEQEVLNIARRNRLAGIPQEQISLLHPSAFTTLDEMENDDAFDARCYYLLNGTKVICYIVQDSSGQYSHLVANSRSALLNDLKSLSEDSVVWPFCTTPYTYLADREKLQKRVDVLPEGKVLFSARGYAQTEAIYVAKEKDVVSSLLAQPEAASLCFSSDELKEAIRLGVFYTSESNIPIDEFFSLAPWELASKYPGATVITGVDSTLGVHNRKGPRVYYAMDSISSYSMTVLAFAKFSTSTAQGGAFLLASATSEGYEKVQKNTRSKENYALTKWGNPIPGVFSGISGDTKCAAFKAIQAAGEVPSFAINLWHNKTPVRKTENTPLYVSAYSWACQFPVTTTTKKKENQGFLVSRYCPTTVVSLLERNGYSTITYRAKKMLSEGIGTIEPISFLEAFSIAYYAVNTIWEKNKTVTSLAPSLASDKLRKEATFLMCFMASLGLVSSESLNALFFNCDSEGNLFCPGVTDWGAPLTDNDITEDNVENVALAITLYGAATVDPLVCAKTSDAATLWNKAKTYTALMWRNKTNLKVASLFAFNIECYRLIATTSFA